MSMAWKPDLCSITRDDGGKSSAHALLPEDSFPRVQRRSAILSFRVSMRLCVQDGSSRYVIGSALVCRQRRLVSRTCEDNDTPWWKVRLGVQESLHSPCSMHIINESSATELSPYFEKSYFEHGVVQTAKTEFSVKQHAERSTVCSGREGQASRQPIFSESEQIYDIWQ